MEHSKYIVMGIGSENGETYIAIDISDGKSAASVGIHPHDARVYAQMLIMLADRVDAFKAPKGKA